MTRQLRVITPDATNGDMTMAEAIRAQAEKIVADLPGAVLMIWQMPDGTMKWAALPDVPAVVRGIVDELHEEIHPVMVVEE